MRPTSFSRWQKALSGFLSVVIVANTGLFSGTVFAQTYEVKLDDFRSESPQDEKEFGLVNVLVEGKLLEDRDISSAVQDYCRRVQEVLGTVCMITPWEGEKPSRIVEALQQMYFEGVEVSGGLAKLVGLVIVGDVPLPVVHLEQESFPSVFPYVDFVEPAYVYDPLQQRFARSSSESAQAEVWHGLIRPPGEGDGRLEALKRFFEKNVRFYEGDETMASVENRIAFHDQFWENDAFDNEAKRWYFQKIAALDRLVNYRYSGEWLQQLSGEAVDILAKLTARTFDDAPVEVEKSSGPEVDEEVGFDEGRARQDSATRSTSATKSNADVDLYGADRLQETVPDSFSPGPIRNLLKDYVNVVARYVSGTSELLEQAGRRQAYETLASLITILDKYSASVVDEIDREFEQYIYEQAKTLAVDFELIEQFEKKNDFYTEELSDAVTKLQGGGEGSHVETKLKSNILAYGSKIFHRFVNGVRVQNVQTVDDCSIEKGSNFIADDGELGRAISLNRKDNPMTSQDVSGASGPKVKEEIKEIYKSYGNCSYMVKGQCIPGGSKKPLLDYGASEIFDGDNDYRRCFDHDGPTVPKDVEKAVFQNVSSLVNHNQPTGETVRKMLERKLAHYFPIDAVRHVSFYQGGVGQYRDENVGRIKYPNFFEIRTVKFEALQDEIRKRIQEKERDLRKMRIEANWKRFEQYIGFSSPVAGRPDFWNYAEVDAFAATFQQYRETVTKLIRADIEQGALLEDFEVVEQYLLGDTVSDETELKIQEALQQLFPTALAHQNLGLKCDYSYDVPPINLEITIPKIDRDDVLALDLPTIEIPKFSPPSVTRDCKNETAKNTVDEAKSLRAFYALTNGARVDIALLHDADGFIEVLDPAAVILFFTPSPPPAVLANQAAAIKLFDQQLEDLRSGPQPVTNLMKLVKPVPLLEPGELQPLLDRYELALQEAIHWLNLGIEAKHQKGLSMLAKDKEMVYVAMDGDADHLDFTLPNLETSFDEEADPSIASRGDLIDELRRREKALEDKQREQREKRALERRIAGEKSSACGDSVPLLEWPGAVSCWLQEIVAGPLIAPRDPSASAAADSEEIGGGDSGSSSDASEPGLEQSVGPGEIALSEKVIFIKDRAVAKIHLPLETEVTWSATGSVRVVPQRQGEVAVIPESVGAGSLQASFSDGVSQRVATAEVRVVDRRAVLRQVTVGDVQIGADDTLGFAVEVRNVNDQIVNMNSSLQVTSDVANAFQLPQAVPVQAGKGEFTVQASRKAGVASIRIGSADIAASEALQINSLAGQPAQVRLDLGDGVVGIDGAIEGQLLVQDQYGNPYRAEGLKVNLVWDQGLIVNGEDSGRGDFFVVAGQLPLSITVKEELYRQAEDAGYSRLFGYGYATEENPLREGVLPKPRLRVGSLAGFENIRLPDAVVLDIDPTYRVLVPELPSQIAVGSQLKLEARVVGKRGSLLLNKKVFTLQQESGGVVESVPLPLTNGEGTILLPIGATSGKLRFTIDDPDFGSVVREVEVVGQQAERVELVSAMYVNGEVSLRLIGKDRFGNPASLENEVVKFRLIGEGAEVLLEQSVVIENLALEQTFSLAREPDRVRLEVMVENIGEPLTRVLTLQHILTSEQVASLPWETPYMILAGSAFGDYRSHDSIAQAMLFGEKSRVQALTTELVPHVDEEKVARIWPTGRVTVGPNMKSMLVWENLKPVMVFSDPEGEVGRLFINPRDLAFEVETAAGSDFEWSLSKGRGKALLVPGLARYEARTSRSGDLFSAQGEKLISFDQSQVVLHDPSIETEVFDDAGDVLVLEFVLRQQTLARWYLHFPLSQVGSSAAAVLQWQFSGQSSSEYRTSPFYAGEGTSDQQGLNIQKKGTEVRTSLGRGRSALDDVRQNNGQGFGGDDKSALSFLAGNSVGESTLLQSEGMVNLGDPVISLRQAKVKDALTVTGEVIPTNAAGVQEDYSIGQLVFAPENGKITHLLRLDVEGDRDDDLVMVVSQGKHSVVKYLEGNGEGQRWGSVSQLLDLGSDVLDVQALEKKSLVVLYASGQVSVEHNISGKYTRRLVDLSALGQEDPTVVQMSVRDFDEDGIDDLLFLSGDRELWVWYGSQTVEGIQFGLTEKDRQLLRVMSVRLRDAEQLKTAAWLSTPTTPQLQVGCRDQSPACKTEYFRALDGVSVSSDAVEEDRLQMLIDQSKIEPKPDPGEQLAPNQQQQYLMRLDQEPNYQNGVAIEILNKEEGAQLNQRQVLDFELRLTARRTENPLILRYDLGKDFKLVGTVSCDICSEKLQISRTPDSLWSLEGEMATGQTVVLNFSVEYQSLPDFSFQVMNTNADVYPDIGINVGSNDSNKITLFESLGARQYRETIFGQDPPVTNAAADAGQKLADIMRGIGIEGMSQDEIRGLIMEQGREMEANSGNLFDSVHEDKNRDGYPDLYQENLGGERTEGTGGDTGPVSLLEQLKSWLIPQVKAQGGERAPFKAFDSSAFSGLDNASLMLDDVKNNVQNVIKALTCTRGCLPLPMNFAFLAPGPINIFGEPAGFDPGVPMLGISPVPFFIWPPLVAYQVTQFRLYISPTLTGGVGIAVCLGQYLLGQCMAFAIPLNQLGGEAICDAAKQGLGFLMQGVTAAIGHVNAAVEGVRQQINNTGVLKAKAGKTNVGDVGSIIGVSLGGSTHEEGLNPLEPKVFLQPIPKIFVDWWDRQWEEVINSLTDLPDISVRLPDFSGAFGDRDFWDKMGEKVTGDTFLNLQQLYDLINSLPVVNLQAQALQIQIPWIEPGLLSKIEQSLYRFLFDFMLELVAFLKSFNLPCSITVVRADLFNEIRKRVKSGVSQQTEDEILALKRQMDAAGADLQAAEKELQRYSEQQGFAQETVELRRAYFEELRQKQQRVNQLNTRYTDFENEINRLDQPGRITEVLPMLAEVLQLTGEFWNEQLQGFTAASLKEGANRETAEALRSCVALKLGVNLTADVNAFINSIKKNLEALEQWKEFPRQLARYLNVFEFYIQEVIKLIDQLTEIVLKWWSEFERKLDLWIDVIYSFQEFIAMIQLIIDILKGYNKKCGLCTSDRLTLKELILKIVFGVVPKLPIIDFPTWPDIRLDFSDVKLNIDVKLPVFDVKAIELKWPQLPKIKFPRFSDINISAAGEFTSNFSVALPQVPLVIPSPPPLPPLQPLPNLPEINLPNLPPAPEVPKVLESLLPLMKIIQTILDIWCLINKSLLPIDEKVLKTQIENLTNRSLNLILPIDLMLEFDLLPGDLLSSLVPFDLINVKSQFEAGVNIDPLPGLQQTIDQQFHQPMDQFLQQIDGWIEQLKNTSQQGLGGMQEQFQDMIRQFQVQGGVNVQGGINSSLDLRQEFPELLNYQVPAKPTEHKALFQQKRDQIVASHEELKKGLIAWDESLQQLKAQGPEAMLRQLAQYPADHVLVQGAPTILSQQVAQEKREALYSVSNMVEKQISWVDKPGLIAQLESTTDGLTGIQQQLLGTEPAGINHLGTAVVRNGEARRLQDYPLEDPVVEVWDNDVFLAYEKALYLKSVDNTARRPEPYSGGVLRASLSSFQHSAVHQLAAESVSSSQSGVGQSTVRWTWEAPGVEDVELTLWDTVGGAQRIDSRHTRFYLHERASRSSEGFQVLTSGIVLQEGQPMLARREVRLRFGEDQVIIPLGVTFTIPSLVLREVQLQGDGEVRLEQFSGDSWNIELAQDTSLEVVGTVAMTVQGPQIFKSPSFQKRPFVSRVVSRAAGALKSRISVEREEEIPAGEFYVIKNSRLVDEKTGAEMTLVPGIVLQVSERDDWKIVSGTGEVMVSDDLSYREAVQGMVLFDQELLMGNFVVQDGQRIINVSEEQQAMWSEIDGPSFEVTLPVGNYYGRIREQEGKRGFSNIVHAPAAQPRFAAAQLIPGIEQIRVPVYSAIDLDGGESVIGDLSEESYHWKLQGEETFVTARQYHHRGFDTVGKRTLELFIRDGEREAAVKQYVIDVYLPSLELDEQLFEESRIIRLQSEPGVAGLPVGIVGERDGVQDWFLSAPVLGSRLEQRYYTDENGVVQLQPLKALEGLNIIIENGRNVARLYGNGRVVLHDEYREACQNEAILDTDGYLKFRISCVEEGRLVKKFEVRMIPDRDTDVSVVDRFSAFDTGVSVRVLQPSLEAVSLGQTSSFAPGAVQLRVREGEVVLVVSPDGRVEVAQTDLVVRPKAFVDPTEPLVWEVLRNDAPLAEIIVKGPSDHRIVDPVQREVLVGDSDADGMLDRWESTYNLTDPNEDADTDGLSNLQEFEAGSSPRHPDTDGDGLLDGAEEDPLSADSTRRRISFRDLGLDNPYYEAITSLAQLGFIQGYEDGTFKPDQPVTRAEALKILMSVIRCENCESPLASTRQEYDPTRTSTEEVIRFHQGVFGESADPLKVFDFTEAELRQRDQSIGTYFDVSVEDWYYYCVEIATQLGLVHGYRGFEQGRNALGQFIPNRGVNIAELVKMVVEAIGQKGKPSQEVYGPADGWWNDPANNYLATAEEDLKLFLEEQIYQQPQRSATRAEVAYAAWRVLKENDALDFDQDGVKNQADQCPCQVTNTAVITNGCPVKLEVYGPRRPEDLFAGIEITQSLNCSCLVVVPADLYRGSSFFGVITGSGNQSDRVYVKSNVVAAGEGP